MSAANEETEGPRERSAEECERDLPVPFGIAGGDPRWGPDDLVHVIVSLRPRVVGRVGVRHHKPWSRP